MAKLRVIAMLASISVAAGYGLERFRRSATTTFDASLRGRHASTPVEMTWLGMKDVLLRTYAEANDDRLLAVAASVAFYALLALVPALSVLISIYGLFTDANSVSMQMAPLTGILPGAAAELIEEQAKRLAAQSTGKLSLNLIFGLAVAGWSANAAIKAMFDGLNVIYGETEKRSLIYFNFVSLMTTFGAVVLLIAALFLIAILPAILEAAPFGRALEATLATLRWPLFYAVAVMGIAVLYWIGPSRRAARFEWVLPGALIAALLWAAVSGLFSWYVSTLGDYTATYGSLATVIVFMTWLWLSASVILLGAEFNAELEHQTAHDTTQGPEKPMGMRGAVVADAIGPAVAER